MSVKKLLILGAAGLAAIGATAILAGGPDHMAMPVEPSFQNSVYLDVDLGYAQSNWNIFNSSRLIGTSASSLYYPTSAGKGGFSVGADLGYNITRHIAVEGAWYYLPEVAAAVTATGRASPFSVAAGNTIDAHSWVAYTAAKLSVPVADNVDLYGKVGVGYRGLTYSFTPGTPAVVNANAYSGNGHYWTPVFGTGVQYNWGSWMLGAQYLYVPGNDQRNNATPTAATTTGGAPNAAPEVNLYTGFLGYKFNV